MGGFFAVASKENCVLDLFFGTDYHSHLGTRRAGMAVHGPEGFNRAIHNIQNSPFRTKFERMWKNWMETSEPAAFQTLIPALFWYIPIWEASQLPASARLTMPRN